MRFAKAMWSSVLRLRHSAVSSESTSSRIMTKYSRRLSIGAPKNSLGPDLVGTCLKGKLNLCNVLPRNGLTISKAAWYLGCLSVWTKSSLIVITVCTKFRQDTLANCDAAKRSQVLLFDQTPTHSPIHWPQRWFLNYRQLTIVASNNTARCITFQLFAETLLDVTTWCGVWC